jgi:gliding motility-associated-like protein
MKRIITLCGLFMFNFYQLNAQLVIDNTTQSPADLLTNVLVGTGVTISNVEFNGSTATALVPTIQAGEFTGTTSMGITNGIILATGDAQLAASNNNNGGATLGGTGAVATDIDLNALSGLTLYDQAVLEFDFVPAGDSISFKYVFGSEEYLEWVGSGYNDVFGFFLSGPGITGPFSASGINLATVPFTTTPITINTINNVTNAIYYVNNGTGTTPLVNLHIQYDGFTVIMTAKAAVNCGETYHIKLAIADAGDAALDSGVFLEAGSFTSDEVQVDLITTSGTNTIIEGCLQGGTFSFLRPSSGDSLSISVFVTGNAINGVDYTPAIPSTITFLPGQDSVGFSFLAVSDGLIEGVDSLVITIYNINSCNDTIVSTVTVFIEDPLPLTIDLGPDLSVSCLGGTLPLDPNATGGYVPYTYIWSTGESTPTIDLTVAGSTQVILTVNGQCGSTDTDTLNITIVPAVPQLWNTQTFSTYCPGDTVTISPLYVSGGSSPFTYAWTGGATTSTITVNPADTTTYTVTITDWCGQDTTISLLVNVRNPTPIDVAVLNDTLCMDVDGAIIISPVVTGGNGAINYTWYENNSSIIFSQTSSGVITVVSPASGPFIITVIDQCGLIAIDTANIVVENCIPVIPNVFTPNGDGVNDNFVITNLELHPNSELLIFNRWGQVVYESSAYQNNWDGGSVSDGVYYYVLNLTDGSTPADYHGFVHIYGKN